MGYRILVVDDSLVMRLMVVRNLRQAGIVVDKMVDASSGPDAIQKFKPGEIDIVFSDLNMPGMSGIELAKRIRGLAPRVPILLITAEGNPAKLQEAFAAGVTATLQKPPTPEDLRDRLDAIFHPPAPEATP